MHRWTLLACLGAATLAAAAEAKTVVFQEPGFPTIESLEVSEAGLRRALPGDLAFVGIDDLMRSEVLAEADLLVLPYGSAYPQEATAAIDRFMEGGGNLLVLGGRAFFVPVRRLEGRFEIGREHNDWWRRFWFTTAAEVPNRPVGAFAWREDCSHLPAVEVHARRVFAFSQQYGPRSGAGAHLRGIGFLTDLKGRRLFAPVTRFDFALDPKEPKTRQRGRMVMLGFEPEPGYWESAAGEALVRMAAEHAALGDVLVWMSLPKASVWAGESADGILRVVDRRLRDDERASVRVEVSFEGRPGTTTTLKIENKETALNVSLGPAAKPGLYAVRSTYERGGRIAGVHETGFWRRDESLLSKGARLSSGKTYFRKDGIPFLLVGVNHFVNDSVWSSFPENANALAWDRDFAAMAADHLSFVRTGIWNDRSRFVDPVTGAAEEALLRNTEAFLASAGRHGLQVQFTLFNFDPQTVSRGHGILGAGRNPYTDPAAVEAQKTFVRSVVARFRDVPFVSWDLVNEPSFSNPRSIFRGNVPNGDPTEVSRWNEWLKNRYGSVPTLAAAWGSDPAPLGEFGGVPLPPASDLELERAPAGQQVRAFDYNLFAQDMFRAWVVEMVAAVRSTGSQATVGVGHDEAGATNRVLNPFYADAGIGFTSTHTWWYDDNLLWAVLAGRRRGLPHLVGETGTQPAFMADGRVRWTETDALGLVERKLALGLGAGGAGSAYWIWSDVDPYRLGRQDGSRSLWNEVLAGLGRFAQEAAPYLTDVGVNPVAIVLPQSHQLSYQNSLALEAQQSAVRALFHRSRATADLVGEYQLDDLGQEKLLILPSPGTLSEGAWQKLLQRVEAGATLLVTGRFDLDEHFRETKRHRAVGLDYAASAMTQRTHRLDWPGGTATLSFPGHKTTYLEVPRLANGSTFAKRVLGRGKILFFSLPLELGDDPALLGAVYRYALAQAGVVPAYRTSVTDPGILICPTPLEKATLYLLTSESSAAQDVAFVDGASGRRISTPLPAGRAALLLVSHAGEILARYDPSAIMPKP